MLTDPTLHPLHIYTSALLESVCHYKTASLLPATINTIHRSTLSARPSVEPENTPSVFSQ